MGLSIAIVGLPNVGKSTLFNALTKNKAEASNYPFCTIDPNVGIVVVPDERLEKIAEISKPEKTIYTNIEFVDIAGLVAGAHKGEGLGNKFLSHIRECTAICEVIRGFEDKNIVHVNGKIDPDEDRETINLELIFADQKTVDKTLDKATKEAKAGDAKKIKYRDILLRIKKSLDKGASVRDIELDDEERFEIKHLGLLTQKPIIYILNTKDAPDEEMLSKKWGKSVLALDIKTEEEISLLEKDEQKEFLIELGLNESGLDKLIKISYDLLGLITFFTTGKDESRAWTVNDGAKAPEAAGVIHTDFEKGFIRAEVIGWKDFLEVGGEVSAKEKGLIKTEGKEYILRDGDICHFLVN